MRFRSPASYGLMGTFNPLRDTLARVFAEDDRLHKKWEREEWEWKQRRSRVETNKEPAVAPVETVSENDPRIIKRSHSDGVERVWINGWSRSKYLIEGIANTPAINSHNYSLLSRGCELKLPVPLLWSHAQHGGAIGEVCYMQRDEKGIYIRAAVFTHEASQHAWRKIVLGEVSGLSCAAVQDDWHLQAEVGDAKFYDKWRIKEISVVPTPACPGCWFKIYQPGRTL